MKVNLCLRSDIIKSTGLYRVRYLVTFAKGRQKPVNTPISVDKKYWDNKEKQVKSGHPDKDIINKSLIELNARGKTGQRKWEAGEFGDAELLNYLTGKDKSGSVDEFTHTYYKRAKSVEMYRDDAKNLSAFKTFMNVKGDLMFNDVNNYLMSSYKKKSAKLVKDRVRSDKTFIRYAQSINRILGEARRLGKVEKDKILDNAYWRYSKVINEDEAPSHTDFEIYNCIKNADTIQKWQSCAMWLLMFGMRGLYNADIVRLSETMVSEIRFNKEKKIDELFPKLNKDFLGDVYLDYRRSKESTIMVIRLFPEILTLIRYLKQSVIYTHIDKKVGSKPIVVGMKDRLNIFNYDFTNYENDHKQIFKQRADKFKLMGSTGVRFKNARKSFYQIAESTLGHLDAKLLAGHTVGDVSKSYSAMRRADNVRRMEKQHREVLDKFKYDKLVTFLMKRLIELIGKGKAPEWILGSAIMDKNTVWALHINESGEIANTVKEIKIEKKYLELLTNFNLIDVDIEDKTKENVYKNLSKPVKKDVRGAAKVVDLYEKTG